MTQSNQTFPLKIGPNKLKYSTEEEIQNCSKGFGANVIRVDGHVLYGHSPVLHTPSATSVMTPLASGVAGGRALPKMGGVSKAKAKAKAGILPHWIKGCQHACNHCVAACADFGTNPIEGQGGRIKVKDCDDANYVWYTGESCRSCQDFAGESRHKPLWSWRRMWDAGGLCDFTTIRKVQHGGQNLRPRKTLLAGLLSHPSQQQHYVSHFLFSTYRHPTPNQGTSPPKKRNHIQFEV